jgi:hypothetical protein
MPRTMKKMMMLLGCLGMFALAGCGSSEKCSPFSAAATGLTKCTNVQACCTDTQCRYTADGGKEWKCSGTDCTSAATMLVSDCM